MIWVPSGHNNEFHYVKNALCKRSGILFSSELCNESGMQPGQGFLFHSNNRFCVNPSMAAGLRGKIGLSTATSVHERVEGSLPERHRGQRMVMRVDADERCQESAESLSALQMLKCKKILQLAIDRVEEELMHQSICSSVCNCSCRQTTALAVYSVSCCL